MGAQSNLVKFGVGSVLLPATAALIATLLEYVIPGCHCNEAIGCLGCAGLDSVIALLGYGGLIVGTIAFFTVLPISLFIAAILYVFAKPEK